jgi:pSer/pThr/pTyr-binding forkhead associated (FHA) protein
VVSLGANGTYLNGKPITTVQAEDGMIIRLASSGPQIRIQISADKIESKLKAERSQQMQSQEALSPEAQKISKEMILSLSEPATNN